MVLFTYNTNINIGNWSLFISSVATKWVIILLACFQRGNNSDCNYDIIFNYNVCSKFYTFVCKSFSDLSIYEIAYNFAQFVIVFKIYVILLNLDEFSLKCFYMFNLLFYEIALFLFTVIAHIKEGHFWCLAHWQPVLGHYTYVIPWLVNLSYLPSFKVFYINKSTILILYIVCCDTNPFWGYF